MKSIDPHQPLKEPVDYLAIVAHPDDTEYGIAGSVARWVQEGKSVAYVVCTSGEKGTSDRSIAPEQLKQIREKEQLAAAQLLRVRSVQFLRYADQSIEDTPEMRKHIVKIIRTYRPHTVLTTDPYRRYIWHRDHRVIGQVVLDALFPFARDHAAYPDLLDQGFEPHKVREVLFFGAEDLNYFIDVSDTFDTKLAALKRHASQMAELDMDQLYKRVRKRVTRLAEQSGYTMAEGFHREMLPG